MSKVKLYPKIDRLKKSLKKSSIIYIVISIISVALFTVTGYYYDSLTSAKSKIEEENQNLNLQILDIETKTQEAKEAHKLWQKLNQQDKPRDGLAIDNAKIIIKNLQKQYRLEDNLDVNLSTPQTLKGIYETPTTTVVASDVTLKFSGITDEYVYQFIDSLILNFPGFVLAKDFEITKLRDIDSSTISNINKGTIPILVNGSFSFQWRDFKDNAPPANTQSPGKPR